MNEEDFWHIISLLAWDNTGDDDAVVLPAVTALAAYSEADIIQFQDILAEKLFRLDGVSFARHIGRGSFTGDNEGFSPDQFLYIRCCVVANGRETYESVLSNPREMPEETEFEPLLYIAPDAYKLKTGGTKLSHKTPVSYETFSNKEQWKTE